MIPSIISQNAVCIHHILTRKPKDSTWEKRENWGKDRAKVKLIHFGLLVFWWRKHLSLTWFKERRSKWNLPQSMQLGSWSLYRYTYEWMCWNVTRLEFFFFFGRREEERHQKFFEHECFKANRNLSRLNRCRVPKPSRTFQGNPAVHTWWALNLSVKSSIFNQLLLLPAPP